MLWQNIYAAMFFQQLISYFSKKSIEKQVEEGKKTDASAFRILFNILKWSTWFIAVLIILQNTGIDISALLAGAGIIGIALAFSMQEVLADLFACFSIYFDRPFEVGDFIVMENGEKGSVKKIGLKSTRIKSLKGDELIVSNKKLTESVLHNYRKMKQRRVIVEIYVDAKTSIPKLEKGKKIIHDTIEKQEDADPFRVHLRVFNGNSWTYEISYYINTNNYGRYLDIEEAVNLGIRKNFDKEKIKFATDIQKIILKR